VVVLEAEAFAALDVKVRHAAASHLAASDSLAAVFSSFGLRATMREPHVYPGCRGRAPAGDGGRIFSGLRERCSATVAIKSVVVEPFTDGAVMRDEIAVIAASQVKVSPMAS
jgi:hypothetical protein